MNKRASGSLKCWLYSLQQRSHLTLTAGSILFPNFLDFIFLLSSNSMSKRTSHYLFIPNFLHPPHKNPLPQNRDISIINTFEKNAKKNKTTSLQLPILLIQPKQPSNFSPERPHNLRHVYKGVMQVCLDRAYGLVGTRSGCRG